MAKRSGPRATEPPVICLDEVARSSPPPKSARRALRVLTLNLAHGRADGWHQAFLSRSAIRANLDAVASVLKREAPDAVALQEADAPSMWSGRFDHVAYLAETTRLSWFTRCDHVQGLGLKYGTALLARHRLREPLAVTFAPTPPTLSKGFVVATLEWTDHERTVRPITAVSVHLDFARGAARRKQVRELLAVLEERRSMPLVVMGDFNAAWPDDASVVRLLAEKLGIDAFRPDAPDIVTFPFVGRRLDWILASRELRVVDFRVLTDVVSDHYAVLCDLEWNEGG